MIKILKSKWLKIFISLIILIILFYKIGFKDITLSLLKFNFLYFPFIIIAYFFSFLFGAINIKLLTKSLKPIKFLRILEYYTISWCYGLLSIGRIGELSMIYFLKNENIPLGKATAISIIDRATTFISVSIIAIFGFFIFFTFDVAIRLILALFLIIIFAFFFIITKKGRSIIKKHFKYAKKFSGFSKTLFYFLKQKKATLLINFILTNLKWITTAYINYYVFLAFGIDVPILYIIIITAISAIISLIPISISGLGFRESSGVYLFSKIGVPIAISGSLYLVIGTINYIFSGIVILYQLNKKKSISL